MTYKEPGIAKWTSGICEANAIEIRYLRTGGNKPSLVALHGLMASGACLSSLARSLEYNFDVVMPDARGHGSSSTPSQGYLYRDHAEDVLGLIRALKLNDPILLGHSMGGMTVAVVASKLGSALRSVILVDPTFISPEWQREVYESDVAEEHRQFLKMSRSDLLAQSRLKHPNRSAEIIEHMTDARLQTSLEAFEVLTPPNPDYRELVSSIDAPILLVLASSGIVSVEAARELQSLNPLLRYELIPDVGHGLPYDKPEHLGEVILSFSRSTVADSSR